MINMQPNLIDMKTIKCRGNKRDARKIKMHGEKK